MKFSIITLLTISSLLFIQPTQSTFPIPGLIQHVCRLTPHYHLCVLTLKSHAVARKITSSADIAGLAKITVGVIAAKTPDILATLHKIHEQCEQQEFRIALEGCIHSYTQISTQILPKALSCVDKGDLEGIKQSALTTAGLVASCQKKCNAFTASSLSAYLNGGSAKTGSSLAGSTNVGSSAGGSINTGSSAGGSINTGSSAGGSINTGSSASGGSGGSINTGSSASGGSSKSGSSSAGSTNTGSGSSASGGSSKSGSSSAGSTNTGSGSASSGSINTGSGSASAGSTGSGLASAGGSINTGSGSASGGSINTGSGSASAGSTGSGSTSAGGSINTGSGSASAGSTGSASIAAKPAVKAAAKVIGESNVYMQNMCAITVSIVTKVSASLSKQTTLS